MGSGYRYVVAGRVQGVGFRWFVWREAQRLELAGYVSNLGDGTVEVVARGTEEALETLETAISRGPLGARVDGVDKSVVSHEIVLPKPFDIK